MRTTFREDYFTFKNTSLQGWDTGDPDRLIVHRQGNPGAHAWDALAWGDRTGAFTIQTYIEDDLVIHCVPMNEQAFHAAGGSAAKAAEFGWPNRTPGGTLRGDIKAVGIETVDLPGGGPGQTYHLSQETRISLVLVAARMCREQGWDPLGRSPKGGGWIIDEHGTYDPVNRPEDLGNALYIPDLRLDVADLLAGREPWRTVQEFAYGKVAPDTWKPTAPPPPPPPPPPTPTLKQKALERIGIAETAIREAREAVEALP